MARKGRYIGFHGLNLVFLMSKVIQHGFFIKKFVLHTGSHCIHGRQASRRFFCRITAPFHAKECTWKVLQILACHYLHNVIVLHKSSC